MRGREDNSSGEGKKAESRSQAGDRDRRMAGKPPFFKGWEKNMPLAGEGETAREEDSSCKQVKNHETLATDRGEIAIENYYPADKLERLTVDQGICMFSRHNPDRQKEALINVANSEFGNVIAAVGRDKLVAYIGIHHPSERERWGKPGYPWLYEFGAIEVSRNYRRLGLSEAMLQVAFDDPYYDDKIMITTGFTWHWDLEETGMTKMEYRELGIKLFGSFGFMEMATDEPNVAMDSANLFLVRIGKDASLSRYQRFASLLFSNEWEAMLRGF